MKISFPVKSIVFYTLSAICALTICGIVSVATFFLFEAVGLEEVLSFPLFVGGFFVIEACLSVYCISVLSEDVLYYIGEYDDEEHVETTEEKET